jgi:flagellar basal-body rod protein FlgF
MTINGMTSAANALRYWERRQEITANNLANVSTDGFKAERAFSSLLNGAPVIGTTTDSRAGMIRTTGGPMDLAIGGGGYLGVQTPAGERLSSGGSLRTDSAGFLADQDGHRVLGNNGPIKVTGTEPLTIDAHGTILSGGHSVDGKGVEQLRIESAPSGVSLQHEGGTLFVPAATRSVVPADQRSVRQGAIEESNVDSLGGLVDMIGVQRAYSAVEKSITILDHVRDTAASQLGKPAA